ncbi:MAG: hypothetical protein SO087_03080 [Candidatus Onthovivens sp.]|nr:hypothetical protein [Candidatus Onthovivens sp.]
MNRKKFENKELYVRKVLVSFIEDVFNFLGYNLAHDRIKKVLYAEDSFKSIDEEKIKRVYDAYIYLVFNAKNPLTNRILNTFFYIYFGKEIDTNISLRIASKFFDFIDKPIIESATDFHICVFNEIDFINEEDKLIISLIFFNYFLIKNDTPTIRMMVSDLESYLEKKKEYENGNKISLFQFFFELIDKAKVQDKSYYQNLKELTLQDIYITLKEDEEFIKKNYSIKHLSVFGSFAKQINRIDSDIDLLASFSLDLTSNEKKEIVVQFKNHYFNKFSRFIDVSEISEYLDDEFIKRIPYVKKIF